MICDALQTWTKTRTGPGVGGDSGWGGVGLGSWGWAFSFLCFGIIECAHGHAYAKQVRIMCVLSVPLLDQVQGVPKFRSRSKTCSKHVCMNITDFDDGCIWHHKGSN